MSDEKDQVHTLVQWENISSGISGKSEESTSKSLLTTFNNKVDDNSILIDCRMQRLGYLNWKKVNWRKWKEIETNFS